MFMRQLLDVQPLDRVRARAKVYCIQPLTTMYEKGPYEENIWNVYICGKRPLLEHGVYEKVPCAHACARLSRLSFRALLTSVRCTRRGLTKKIYGTYIFAEKGPFSNMACTRRCLAFQFLRVTN